MHLYQTYTFREVKPLTSVQMKDSSGCMEKQGKECISYVEKVKFGFVSNFHRNLDSAAAEQRAEKHWST